jgi:hypothetical protein
MTTIKPLALAALAFLASYSQAEFINNSYSYFAIGSDKITYSESLPSFAGASFESELSTHALAQRSGGYTAVSKDSVFGFFIATQSTLIAADGNESWDANWDSNNDGINDSDKTVQTDQASINQANLDLLGVYHLKNGFFLTAGLHYQKVSFTRYDFSSTLNTGDFSDFTLENSSTYLTLKDEIENGDGSALVAGVEYTTDTSLREALRFNPEALTPVVAEDLTAFNIVGGIGYDSFFIDREPGIRYKFSFSMGTPIYLHVLNTNVSGSDRSLSETLSGGIDISANGSVGYQFSEKISVLASVSMTHAERESISVTNSAGQRISLPDNTFTAITPELAFFWAF